MAVIDLLISLLGDTSGTPPETGDPGGGKTMARQLLEILVVYVFPVILGVMVLWAIYIGFHFGNAKDEGARRQAKERFFKALAGVVIIMVLYGILFILSSQGFGLTPIREAKE